MILNRPLQSGRLREGLLDNHGEFFIYQTEYKKYKVKTLSSAEKEKVIYGINGKYDNQRYLFPQE